jgi:translocator protein
MFMLCSFLVLLQVQFCAVWSRIAAGNFADRKAARKGNDMIRGDGGPASAYVDLMELAIIIVLVIITASSGTIFKPGAWYERLEKPGWTPPNWAFPVVWTILFILIAWSGWIVWEEGARLSIGLWCVQLFFNAAWSWLFFGLRRMDFAFSDVLLLAATIIAFIASTWSVSPLAALLFLPYLAWVIAASCLNWQVWRMNRERIAA